MDSTDGQHVDSPFDRLHSAIENSSTYREVIRASSPDLPSWLIPASVINTADLQAIAADIDVGNGQTFVDLGCGAGGPGLWVAEHTGASLIGIDASATAIKIAIALAKSRGMSDRARFAPADYAATGLPDECADGVMSLDALMFVDPRPAVREIGRLAKRGGVVVIRSVESLIEPFTPTLVRDYRPIFEEAGFTIIKYEELDDYLERSLQFFRAIEVRADRMRAEIGSTAEILINEAQESIEKAQKSPRVRTVYLTARR